VDPRGPCSRVENFSMPPAPRYLQMWGPSHYQMVQQRT
jgi:hypothetical protein